ncbi:MAG: arginine repressor [Gammaproteobacteria bacterium]|nr:MAG: arginine repressor [Gammaproteobacteria bacterium]
MRKLLLLCAYYLEICMPLAPDIREKRRQAIQDILARRPITRQSQFVELLQAEGIEATQSSVSRDLRELSIAKLDNGYGRVQKQAPAAALADMPSGFVRAVLTAGSNLTVVRTATGAAQRVALFLDRSDWPEIVGTVSGDDTIFVATRNGRDQRQLLSRLRSTLQR